MSHTTAIDVLLVEDSEADAKLFESMLLGPQSLPNAVEEGPPFRTTRVETLADAVDAVADGDADTDIDVVLLDLNLPDSRGIETVTSVLDAAPDVAVVVLTGVDDGSLGTRAVEQGAQDFLVKDVVTPRVLTRTVRYAIERKRSQRELSRANRELTVLNWLVRHDIRNDASVVLGWSQTLSPQTDAERASVERIITAAEHIVEITDSVEMVLQGLTPSASELYPLSLRSVAEDELAVVRERFPEVTFEAGSLSEATVEANGVLSSVVRNLLVNAAVHNDNAEPVVSLSVETGAEGAVLRVADNGPGIPATERERIFARGEKAGDSSGLGVGLYLVGTFVDQYGGSITVENNRPRGTVFEVTFPLADGGTAGVSADASADRDEP